MTLSRVFLERAATGQSVPARVVAEITDEHLEQWRTTWVPAFKAHCASLPEKQWPQDEHWNWVEHLETARNYLAFQTFAIECAGDLQGMMVTSVLGQARLGNPPGKPLIYIELVATAPWNRPEIEKPPRFRRVGTALVKAAIALSLDEGFKGRIGLHSLSGAGEFYRDKCKMTDLGMDRDKGMIYFEMTEKQAKAFLRENT